MLREIKSSQRLVRHLYFLINGTGTAAITQGNFDGTLVDNGTGDYSLTYTIPGQRLLGIFVSPVATAGDVIATVDATSSEAFARVVTFDGTDGATAVDSIFYVMVVLSDAADQT